MVGIAVLLVRVGLFFFMAGFGFRFILYTEDGPNLDHFYKKYFDGRRKKQFAAFTRQWGWVFLLASIVYFQIVLWPTVESILLRRLAG